MQGPVEAITRKEEEDGGGGGSRVSLAVCRTLLSVPPCAATLVNPPSGSVRGLLSLSP